MNGKPLIGGHDLSQPRGMNPTSERVIRNAAINIDPGKLPQCRGDFVITVANLMTGEVWYIPADATFMVAVANNIDKQLALAGNGERKV